MSYPANVAALAKAALDTQKALIEAKINLEQQRAIWEGVQAMHAQANRNYLVASQDLDKAVLEWVKPTISVQLPPGTYNPPSIKAWNERLAREADRNEWGKVGRETAVPDFGPSDE